MDNHIEVEETSSKRDKGFTLVELLIVIVILGILATVTVFAVRGITDKGKTSACQADQKTLETAVEAWYALPATGTGARVDAAPLTEPSEQDLVDSKLMRSLSTSYNIGTGAAAGTLIVQDTACPAVV